jgi:hypothetical protein
VNTRHDGCALALACFTFTAGPALYTQIEPVHLKERTSRGIRGSRAIYSHAHLDDSHLPIQRRRRICIRLRKDAEAVGRAV